MKFRVFIFGIALLGFFPIAPGAFAQNAPAATPSKSAPDDLTPAASTSISKRVEDFLRHTYAWGPEFKVKVGPIAAAPVSDFYEVPVDVTAESGSDSAVVYVTKDGRYMFRGELQDLNADPLAAVRNKLHLDSYASKGPANAPVVLVEFGDFECPSCRQLDLLLRGLLPKYPQVRLVFADFPLEQVHPWALSAAIAGRCALKQSSEVFWKYHDAVYDNQDVISPENAYDKLTDLAAKAGADLTALKACMADPATADAVHKSVEEGRSVDVSSTPTTFVDGRRVVGPDQALLEQYIQYDDKSPSPSTPAK